MKKESSLCWEGPSDIVLYINGVKQSVSGKQVILPVGRSSLLFEVTTDDSLPCIILKGAGLENPDEWQVSMDKEHWTIPESAVMYNKPGVLPDAPQDMTARIKPSQILPMRNAEMQGKDGISIGKNGYVLIDFFHLEIGTLTFQAKGKGTITVRVGETPEEALERDDKKLEQYPLAPVTLSEEGGTITLPERALRYVSLECDKGAEITSLRFDASLWPVEHQMQFETDDDYVNNLFKMSSATLHTSMHRFYLDGVKRDFLPWSMDALVSTLAGDYLFGDQQVSKNGISIALMPLDPQKSDIGIPDYPLHALFGLKQNYLRFGDLTTSLQYKDRIIQLLDFYASIVDENGFVHGNYGDRQFGYTPGWSTYNGPARKGVAAYAQIMLYYNYVTGAYFADLWKESALADRYRKLARNLKKKIFEHFWDNDRKVFINGTMNDNVTVDKRISHHAQYWGILADIFPKEHYDNLFENVLPNLPNYYEVVSYEKGYEFLAYAKAGRIKELWDHIYGVFGDWMDQGHTRFPENFMMNASRARQLVFYNRPYGLSLCHGANGVPVVVGALNGLIGFSQSSMKTNEYTIKPELLHLKWIHSRIPVKEGYIVLKLNAEGESTIDIPAGCTVRIIKKIGKKPLVLREQGGYSFRLKD
ncbi:MULTISPECIES: family 78 glycoside hydrolase catalytic domain [Phocaeicola]|uniref:Glycoside hydrolase family 78 n=2 Tax=Bacteroidaceae TaxID=815 RepID=A6L199_PHOV8|nr:MULTISPECIES: family 78 glycoside hydrolase catalytic domain [Phocaeicola]ABR39463.1 glycoside hydrolase family 78 [Phocaeicola vulgatus ATCC 8482]MCB6495003.1 family 78 glycoside hydrolase catalytic domain [Phocaeicola vulgatus]MCB6511357.1 family 78 glycoside hydrolase catalytic domain [Phocaeicola vulgatus]MCB6639265.1 family 78 glycoside hydrolase catalytic domain [Phocaeicola vulgatus]MCQ4909417.1 family 78 glycoside hydrolase catalytic domain [Phocaeicola vulgatus]